MTQVLAPDLGQSGMDVTIESWLKADGDTVEKGSPLFELSNEKLNQEIEAPASGTLKIIVTDGSAVPPGTVIGEIS